ncbi:MAG: SHOCT domain-containing protein [Burkholderiaceae bacterium]
MQRKLSTLVANQPDLVRSGGFQSQSQGGRAQALQWQRCRQPAARRLGPMGAASLFIAPAPGASADWWPADLRSPNSVGSQNGARYAYFAQQRRLAIEANGHVTVYDTLDHQIGGFSQQQSAGGSMSFNSQHGLIDVASLPVISIDGVARQVAAPGPTDAATPRTAAPQPPAPVAQEPSVTPASDAKRLTSNDDIFATIEKLAALFDKGVLSKAEYEAKKTELLGRL